MVDAVDGTGARHYVCGYALTLLKDRNPRVLRLLLLLSALLASLTGIVAGGPVYARADAPAAVAAVLAHDVQQVRTTTLPAAPSLVISRACWTVALADQGTVQAHPVDERRLE